MGWEEVRGMCMEGRNVYGGKVGWEEVRDETKTGYIYK